MLKFKRKKTEGKIREDLESTKSSLKGWAGFFESFLRKFKNLTHILCLMPIYFIASFCMGLSFWPAIKVFKLISELVQGLSFSVKAVGYGVGLGLGYFLYGFAMLFVTSAFNKVLRTNLTPWRGPYYSLQAVKWYIHNGLIYLVRFTFLEFVTPTPLNLMFYRMMGMKIGEHCQINTVNISDPSLIELGHKVTIGGSVTIVGHYGASGYLIFAPVKIGDNVTVGLRAIIMADVEVGDGAKILPNSVVMPKTRIPAGEIWGGVPAVKIFKAKSNAA